MKNWFEFTSGQIKILIVLCIVLVLSGSYRLVKYFSSTGPEPLKLTVELSDGNKSYAPVMILDLNLSPVDSLELIPGIGPVLAERIATYRDSTGPFERVSDVMAVAGIGYSTFEKIKPYLKVSSW